MSKSASRKKSSFTYTSPHVDRPLPPIATDWDLKGLFYKDHNDPRLEIDTTTAITAMAAFAKKYSKKNFTETPESLLKALKDYEQLLSLGESKPAYYLSLRLALNVKDTAAEEKLNLLEQQLTKAGNELIFFELAIGKIPVTVQKALLKDQRFAPYHYYLKKIFAASKYWLSEAEEKILNLKSITSRGMWIGGTEKILGAAEVKVGKETLPLNGALMELLDAPWERRHALWKACVPVLKSIGPVAENELVALITDKKINDELRGRKKPYSGTVDSYEVSEASLETLSDVIASDGYALSRQFFALKKKLLDKELTFIDRNQTLGDLPTVTYETAVAVCRDAFYDFNPLYGQLFDDMLSKGCIDAFPKPGKGGGAFCASATGVPTVVLLNHANDFGSVSTLAHEMGHAIHAYRSKEQSVFYDGHSTVTAETASTFFEAVVAHALLPLLTPEQRVLMLDTIISGKIDTMIMCIARFRAELELHETIRQKGAMTWQDMSAVLAKHFRAYCGKAITITDDDGLSVIQKTHYRRNFYQFTYSFGQIMSSIMWHRYQQNAEYAKEVDTFLTAGNKANVETIFKEIGIDTTNADVFKEGLTLLADEIKSFTTLAKKYQKSGG